MQRLFAFLLLLPAIPAWAQVSVQLSSTSQLRTGVEIQALQAGEAAVREPAFLQALDIGALATLDAELQALAAVTEADELAYQRSSNLAALDQSEAPRAVEAARVQMLGSRSRLHLLQQRMQLEWGTAIAALPAAERTGMVDAVARGEAALVRADVPGHQEGVSGNILLDADAGEPLLLGAPLGFAATLDARLQTIGLVTLARGNVAHALRPGRLLTGYVETDEKVRGVIIPRDAIVRLAGQAWVYRQTGAESFERVALPQALVFATGWLVQEGFAEGDRIVVAGIPSLLAAETAAPGGEE